MMPRCLRCDVQIKNDEKVYEIAAGFFPKEEVEFFVQDQGLGPLLYVHSECLSKMTEDRKSAT